MRPAIPMMRPVRTICFCSMRPVACAMAFGGVPIGVPCRDSIEYPHQTGKAETCNDTLLDDCEIRNA